MATTTSKLALTKPAGTDLVDIAVLNQNADKIDSAVGATVCTSLTRPVSPWNGQVIIETDTLNQRIWVAATSTWVQFAGTPVGTMILWATNTPPAGYVMCDGSVYANTAYPDLSAVLGITYGGVSGTSFAVPDMRGRVAVGKAASGTFSALNNSGGAETHTLTEAQMPSHNHGIYTEYGADGMSIWNPAFDKNMQIAGVSAGTRTLKNNVITSAGSGQAHNILQPYRVINYAIKF